MSYRPVDDEAEAQLLVGVEPEVVSNARTSIEVDLEGSPPGSDLHPASVVEHELKATGGAEEIGVR